MPCLDEMLDLLQRHRGLIFLRPSQRQDPEHPVEEIEAAAYQFVRKITGVTKPTGAVHDDMHAVALEIAALAHDLLDRLPARRQPPKTVPPLRRPEVRARMGLEPFPA